MYITYTCTDLAIYSASIVLNEQYDIWDYVYLDF